MYGSLLTEDTYKRADSIFKTIADDYNPALKEFVASGKVHDKNVIETGKSYKACYAAAMKIGISATSSPGCKDVGKCIMDITETIQEVFMARETCVQKFRNDVLYPMERRSEQDGKYIVGIRKKSQDEFKIKVSETEKAYANLAKLKKKSVSKLPSKKTDEKIQKATERLLSAKTASEMVAHEMLNRAFSEERKRYCFFVEKQCDLISAMMDYHRTSFGLLQENLQHWKEIGASYRDLLPGALGLIESSFPRHSNISLDEIDMNMGISRGPSSNDLRSQADSLSYTGSVKSLKGSNSIKRHVSTRITRSPKDIELHDPYQPAIQQDEYQTRDNEEKHQEDQISLVLSDDSSDGRSSVCSSYTKSLHRRSGESEISISSVPSAIDKNEARKSFNDSGISVEEIWSSNHQENHTIKRAKSKHALQNEDEISQASLSTASISSERSEEEKPKAQTPTQPITYEALHDYSPETGSTKMTLCRGDKISVYSNKENGGWIYGFNIRSSQKGWFPTTYAKKVVSQELNLTIENAKQLPETPKKYDPSRIRGIAVPVPVLNKTPTKVTNNDKLKSPMNSFGQLSPRSPKDVWNGQITAGQNVFQFAKESDNAFEDIHLRKTNESPLH